MKSKIDTNQIIKICVFLSIATCSFDIFANVTIWGLNFRFCQFILMPVMIMLFVNIVKSKKIRLYLGMKWLLIWLAFQIFFIIRSPNLGNAVAYVLWLMFNIGTVYLICFYSDFAFTIEQLIRIYLNSFFWMAILGYVQMALFFVGINFYVTQHWNDRLCRINGFTFEPSYYATYMLLGFVMYAYLIEKHDENIMKRKQLIVKFVVISVAMVLSSSRMGWLMMLSWFGLRGLNFLLFYVKRREHVFKEIAKLCSIMILAVVGLVIVWNQMFKSGPLSFLLKGVGVYGQPAHSITSRMSGLLLNIKIFMDHPWIGFSLGGVSPIIAQYRGMVYDNSLNGGAMSLIGELLVANGIIGMIPFVLYMWQLLFQVKWWKKDFDQFPLSNVYRAVEWALFFELAILCMNQNILRVYLWVHIGILCALHKELKLKVK